MKLSGLMPQDTIGKVSAVIQFVIYLVLLTAIFVLGCKFIHNIFLRILLFIADYFACSMFLYLVIKPAANKLEDKFRK